MIVDVDEHREGAAASAVPASGAMERKQIGRYLIALALYVALAVATLAVHSNVFVLNWIVGPLFPFIALYAIPGGVRFIARRVAPR